LLNIISNRNYSTPQIYKIFYFGYYFLTLLIIFATLFNKNYVILSILASIVFVINGRKYEDRERLITEYLPISFKEKVKRHAKSEKRINFIKNLFDKFKNPKQMEIYLGL